VGPVDPAYLEYLALVLPESAGLPFRISERALAADASYDPLRRQWNAAKILQDLQELGERQEAERVLGITEVDLFIPILTFVFGLAHLRARAAVISLARLRQEFYGLAPDPEVLLERLEKEAVHELGHTWGLVHCSDFACTMHFSNAAEEIDLKGRDFCERCSLRLADIRRGSVPS
jgi:archaemetzincin